MRASAMALSGGWGRSAIPPARRAPNQSGRPKTHAHPPIRPFRPGVHTLRRPHRARPPGTERGRRCQRDQRRGRNGRRRWRAAPGLHQLQQRPPHQDDSQARGRGGVVGWSVCAVGGHRGGQARSGAHLAPPPPPSHSPHSSRPLPSLPTPPTPPDPSHPSVTPHPPQSIPSASLPPTCAPSWHPAVAQSRSRPALRPPLAPWPWP